MIQKQLKDMVKKSAGADVGLNLRMSQDRVKLAHPVFHIQGRVMLNKL